MGRKSRSKKINNFWNECLTKAKNAPLEQKQTATNLFSNLCSEHANRQGKPFAKALNRVFDDHGDILGSLVMVEFAKSEGRM